MDQLPPEQAILYNLLVTAINQQTTDLKMEFNNANGILKEELEESKRKITQLKNRCLELERRNRKNNIVAFNFQPKKKENLLQELLSLLNQILETDIKETDINNYYRIGKTNEAPIVLEFVSFLKKKSLFKNPNNLNKLSQQNIGISNDLGPEDREELKTLKLHLKEAKLQGHEAKIRGLKLIINDTAYTSEQLKLIENETQSETDILESETEEEEEKKTSKGQTKKGSQQQTVKNLQQHKQPLANKTNSAQQKRKRTKYTYSPPATRSTSTSAK